MKQSPSIKNDVHSSLLNFGKLPRLKLKFFAVITIMAITQITTRENVSERNACISTFRSYFILHMNTPKHTSKSDWIKRDDLYSDKNQGCRRAATRGRAFMQQP